MCRLLLVVEYCSCPIESGCSPVAAMLAGPCQPVARTCGDLHWRRSRLRGEHSPLCSAALLEGNLRHRTLLFRQQASMQGCLTSLPDLPEHEVSFQPLRGPGT